MMLLEMGRITKGLIIPAKQLALEDILMITRHRMVSVDVLYVIELVS